VRMVLAMFYQYARRDLNLQPLASEASALSN
jgi:hypothetical protein